MRKDAKFENGASNLQYSHLPRAYTHYSALTNSEEKTLLKIFYTIGLLTRGNAFILWCRVDKSGFHGYHAFIAEFQLMLSSFGTL